MNKKILITGVSGFVGSHLADYCLTFPGVKVFGTIISHHLGDELKRVEDIKNKIKLFECDLTNRIATARVLNQVRPEIIFHLAAQSFVPTSWKSPEDSLFNNIMAELNILEVVRELKLNPIIQIAGCYSFDTRALTRDGFKHYHEIKKGDLVLSINPENENIEYKQVKKVIIKEYRGKMMHFKSRSCDLLVTPNHRMLIKKRKETKLRFVEANKIKGRNYLPLGRALINKKVKSNYPSALFYLVGIFIGDGYLVPTKKIWKWSGLSHSEYISKRDTKGRFIQVPKLKNKTYSSPRAFLAIPRQDRCRKKVEKVLEKLKIKYQGYDQEIYFVPKGLVFDILKDCNKGAHNKTIPQWMLSLPRNFLQELFNGLIDSDGYWRKHSQGFSTTSPSLVPQFIELSRKIGKWVSLNERMPRKVRFKTKNKETLGRASFEFSITEGEKIITDGSKNTRNKNEIFYDGIIWCVEVEDNHNLLVERNGKVCFCGNSSEEYGLIRKNELPVKENNPLRPLSTYAVSKITQDTLACQYHQSYGLRTVVTRCFNTEGPRRGRQFVISAFAYQIAAVEKGLQKPLMRVGNLEAYRDFTDVRDTVRALWLAVNKCKFGEPYNIGSGKVHQIKEVLENLLSLSKVKIKVEKDPQLMRPSDVPILQSDSTKFQKLTGWKPKINFQDTLKDTLNYWRNELANK